MKISVIICTHNPRKDYLAQTISGLRAQSFAIENWELIIIDNLSEEPVSDIIDLSWHANSQILIEEKLGLTHARIRGAQESQGDWLLYVDDDNILAPDYLENLEKIIHEFPRMGAIGAAIVRPVFEIEPDPEVKSVTGYLALRDDPADGWTNQKVISFSCIPVGAGMAIKREVMTQYTSYKMDGPIFDRVGKDDLSSAGDVEIALYATELGLGLGVFRSLSLQHLISKDRVDPRYLLRLVYGCVKSLEILRHIYVNKALPRRLHLLSMICKSMHSYIKAPSFRKKVIMANMRAKLAAYSAAKKILSSEDEGAIG